MGLRDPISSASHLLTAVWAAYATLILIRLTTGKRSHRISVIVFGASMVVLYLASGTFHGVPFTRLEQPAAYHALQKIDQSAIFILIAGTNTPILVMVIGGALGRWLLAAQWTQAAVGIAMLWLVPNAPHYAIVACYLAMGWLGFIPMIALVRILGWRPVVWIWLGAAAYSIGAACELLEWPVISVYPVRFAYHEILHLCDTLGTLFFFMFVLRHVVPYPHRVVEPIPEPPACTEVKEEPVRSAHASLPAPRSALTQDFS